MIRILEEKYIFDIVHAHMFAWKKAFKGILSDDLLRELETGDFIEGWKHNLHCEERTNLIFINEKDQGVGFVAFGVPENETELVNHEIYGIYVHPDYWDQKIGYQLMAEAINRLQVSKNFKGVILWVMVKNKRSRKFYEMFGFKLTKDKRISSRNAEDFEEVKYIYQ